MSLSYSLRAATERDTPAIAAVIDDGMSLDRVWIYRFPYRNKYREYHRRSIHERLENYFQNAQTGGCAISVIEGKDTSENTTKIVGVAIWQMPGTIMTAQQADPTSWRSRSKHVC